MLALEASTAGPQCRYFPLGPRGLSCWNILSGQDHSWCHPGCVEDLCGLGLLIGNVLSLVDSSEALGVSEAPVWLTSTSVPLSGLLMPSALCKSPEYLKSALTPPSTATQVFLLYAEPLIPPHLRVLRSASAPAPQPPEHTLLAASELEP